MLNTSNAPSKLERGTFQAMLSTAKREYRARVWADKGGKVINNTYRDNISSGQLCVLYVSPEGRKFRSWKQCVRYMGEDPLASVSWKDLVSNGEETNPPTAGANYNLKSAEVQALPWTRLGSRRTDPSSPGQKGNLPNGDRSLIQKAQTLNVISSSSEESHGRKGPPPVPNRQAVISISSSKEMDNEKDGSSSSSSSSAKSISPASSSYGNSALSSSSSEELHDREDAEMDMANGSPPGIPAVTEEDNISGYRSAMARKPLRTVRPLTNRGMQPGYDAANRSPSPKLPPKSAADEVIPYVQSGAEAATPAKEAVCAGKSSFEEADNISNAAAPALLPDTKAEFTKKRKVLERAGEEEEQQEEREGLQSQNERNCEAVAGEPLTTCETRPPGAKAVQHKTQRQQATDPQEDQKSNESVTSLKELTWKMFEEGMTRREILRSFPKKKSPKESNTSRTRDGTCYHRATGATIIVVCPCSIRNSHK